MWWGILRHKIHTEAFLLFFSNRNRQFSQTRREASADAHAIVITLMVMNCCDSLPSLHSDKAWDCAVPLVFVRRLAMPCWKVGRIVPRFIFQRIVCGDKTIQKFFSIYEKTIGVTSGIGLVTCILLYHRKTRGIISGIPVCTNHFRNPKGCTARCKNAVAYTFDREGRLTAVVRNLTSEILTIDNTKSFFITPSGTSMSYYDPKVVTTTTTDLSSSTDGASFNWGPLAGALGIRGVAGGILGGLTTGGSSTSGSATSSTVLLADQPTVSIGPRGSGVLPKTYEVNGLGDAALKRPGINNIALTPNSSRCRFSVCISYSFDGGRTYDKLTTDFYVNTTLTIAVDCGSVSNGFRKIYSQKSDVLSEPFYMFHVGTNIPKAPNVSDTYVNGFLLDYK